MATNIKTVMTYPLDGTRTEFDIPFEYLARKFVQVTLIGQDRKVLVLNIDYRFATKAIISTTKAWGPADAYDTIEIRRYTSATERLVDFTDGSILRAYDLNISQIQTLHVAEEARDLTADTIGVNNDGDLDARGRRIVNVADGVAPGDAITLGQVTRWNESALQSKNAAKVSETNAKASETASKASEQAAAGSESRAKTSETNAKASENLAHDWAQKAENATVTGGEYSAYHYSRKAAASAAASATSAAAAKVSEDNAKTSEGKAKTDADRAKTEADKLQNMNGLAALIDSTTDDTALWKGNYTFVTKESTVAADKRSWATRWETDNGSGKSAYGILQAFRNAQDGGVFFDVSFDGGTRYPFFFVGDGTFNTGRLMTRNDTGRDPVGWPSIFNHTVLVMHNGSTARHYSNGDIVSEAGGTSVFEQQFRAGVRSLGHALGIIKGEAVTDVWMSPAAWWGPFGNVNYRADYNLQGQVGGGAVMAGMTFDGAADRRFLDGIFWKNIWKRHMDNRSGVIGTY